MAIYISTDCKPGDLIHAARLYREAVNADKVWIYGDDSKNDIFMALSGPFNLTLGDVIGLPTMTKNYMLRVTWITILHPTGPIRADASYFDVFMRLPR